MDMRKIKILFITILIVLGVAACDSEEPTKPMGEMVADWIMPKTSSEDKANLEMIMESLDNIEAHIEETIEFVKGQIDDEEGNSSDLNSIQQVYDNIADIKDRFDELPRDCGDTEIQKTYDIAKKYLSELVAEYEDLEEINTYMIELVEHMDRYLEFEEGKDIQSSLVIVYNQIEEFAEQLDGMECPEYMEYTHKYVIEQLNDYLVVLYDMVDAMDKEDVLQASSAQYLNYYVKEKFMDSISILLEDVGGQYEKFGNMLEERATVYHDELCSNCEKQLEKVVKVDYTYWNEQIEATVDYTYEEKIYPATYSVLDSVIQLKANCEQGECDVIVKVEMPDFAVDYEQKLTLGNQFTQLYIKPMLDSNADFDSQKTVQMKITVEDADSGKIYVKESKDITVMSKYDLELFTPASEDGSCYNVLAWLTPEDGVVTKVKRKAIDILTQLSDGKITGLYGYQSSNSIESAWNNTELEAFAIMYAISELGVRYNMDGYSASIEGTSLQRVMYPADVINNKSGLCIETSLLVASVMQSMGYNCMLVFPPNHCFVAVEVYPNTGQYLKIETTAIPSNNYAPEQYLERWDADTWASYIKNAKNAAGKKIGCTIVDCDLGKEIGILPYNEE